MQKTRLNAAGKFSRSRSACATLNSCTEGDLLSSSKSLEKLLVEHDENLHAFVRNNASLLALRYESVEDIVQGVHLQALKAGEKFEYRSDKEFFGWIYQIARHYMYNRTAYWKALRRNSGGLIRIYETETDGFDPVDTGTSPSSIAARREQIVTLTRALARIRTSDRDLLKKAAEGASIEALAEERGVSYDAVKQARLRALGRLRKMHKLIERATINQAERDAFSPSCPPN